MPRACEGILHRLRSWMRSTSLLLMEQRFLSAGTSLDLHRSWSTILLCEAPAIWFRKGPRLPKSGKLLVWYALFILAYNNERGNERGYAAFMGRSSLQRFHVQPVYGSYAACFCFVRVCTYKYKCMSIYIYRYSIFICISTFLGSTWCLIRLMQAEHISFSLYRLMSVKPSTLVSAFTGSCR